MAVHVAHAAHQPVGGRARDQLLAAAAALLGGEHQRAVLDERPRVHQLGEVLARGPAPVLVTAGDRLTAGGVEADLVALTDRTQVGALALRLEFLGRLGQRTGGRPRLERRQQLALADGFTDRHGQLADDPVDVGQHLVLHLHRLEHHHGRTGPHLRIGPERQRDDDRVERRQHRVRQRSAHRQIIPDGGRARLQGHGLASGRWLPSRNPRPPGGTR